jgi:MOSC domain-containing protein YiiM
MSSIVSSPPERLGTEGVRLAAINIGELRPLAAGGRNTNTGIYKQSVSGAVNIGLEGIAGDTIGDRTRHGGDGQEVYLFSAEDLAWWSAELGRTLEPGFFGENLTIDRWWPEPRVGDRLVFDSVTLEISFPRVPCATLAARVGDPGFLVRFVDAARPGLYARVVRPGTLATPADAHVVRGAAPHPSAAELFALWHGGPKCQRLLQAALQAPIPARARPMLQRWLDTTGPSGASAAAGG